MRRLLLAAVLLTSGCAVAGHAQPVPGAENLALVDAGATAAALDGLRVATETAFSYDSANPAAWEKAVADNVTGAAAGQLTALFQQVRATPSRLTTRVVRSAALELAGPRVRALTVVEQVNGTSKGLAALALTGTRSDGRWRIAEIAVSPAFPPPAPHPADGSVAGLRDAALAGARAAATVLLTVDSADPEGTFTRAEEATAEPLRTEYRTNRASYVDRYRTAGVRATVAPNPVAGAVALSPGSAAVVMFATVQVRDAAGKVTQRPVVLNLDVVRDGDAWKVAKIEQLTPS